jgi:hypothetical protein
MVAELEATLLELVLEPGDALVAHTDGVTEARSPDGAFYGEDRFRELLRSLAGADAATIVEAVDADVVAFRSGADPSDDLTLLVVRHQPERRRAHPRDPGLPGPRRRDPADPRLNAGGREARTTDPR